MALTTLVVRWPRIIAGSPGDFEESGLDVVVGPGHATILSALAFAPAAGCFTDGHKEAAGRAGDAAQKCRACPEINGVTRGPRNVCIRPRV